MSVAATQNDKSWLDAISTTAAQRATQSSMQELQDHFLKLLVAQLQNQDPLNPMDNAQMTSQLAQMSTVSGIEKLNSTVNFLVDSLAETQAIQASAMLGKNVLIPGSTIVLNEGVGFGSANLPMNADKVIVTITDSAGNVIQTQEIGPQEAGNMLFAWNGLNDEGGEVQDGIYKFGVKAFLGGNEITAQPMQIGTVMALVRSGNTFLLDLGVLGSFEFSKIQQIL